MVDTTVAPYFDDYDANKLFHRILFRAENPGVTVQARELTQMQTILQDQIARHGRHNFKEGSLVTGPGVNITTIQDVAKITLGAAFSTIEDVTDLYAVGAVSGIRARIHHTVNAENSDPVTIFFDYVDSGADNATQSFTLTETITFYTVDVDDVTTDVATATVDELTQGSWVRVEDSVWFVNGFFVKCNPQRLELDKYSTTPNWRVGFDVTETLVTDDDDATLKSNATGTTNFNSSGAHRLKIELVLSKIDPDNPNDSDFIEIARTETGTLTKQVVQPVLNVLGDTMAQRTFEESGDYTVDAYESDVREHLNDGTNGGVYIALDGGDATKLAFGITPGISYVKGYRNQNIATTFVDMDKARDTVDVNNASFPAQFGMYALVDGVYSYPLIDKTKTIDLHDAAIVGGASAGAIIGTARVRSVAIEDATTPADPTIRLYLFDIQMNTGKTFSDVLGVRYSAAGHLFGGSLVSSTLNASGSGQQTLLFPMPYPSINTLKPTGIDTTYTVMREFSGTTDGSGNITFAVGADEVFETFNAAEYFIAEDGLSGGTIIPATVGNTTLAGAPVGKQVDLTLGGGYANTGIRLIAPVNKQVSTERSKSDAIQVDTLAISGTTLELSKVDGWRLNSVVDTATSQVITDQFEFDGGQRDNFYDLASISTVDGSSLSTTLQVTYEYFTHTSGDYFSVDSYSGIAYEDIPTYVASDGTEYKLSDTIDFRPVKNASGGFDAPVGETVQPQSTIRADVRYYLPRMDSVYIDADGVFGYVKGISSNDPTAPPVPSNAMKLFEVELGAYTYDEDDLTITTIDNRRYTMRDIGKLEDRIENLEYYTTLNLLEAKADSIEVNDPGTGNSRFKNGFVTDGFTDFRLGDSEYIEWAASLMTEQGICRPEFSSNAVDMEYKSGESAFDQIKTGLHLINWTEVESVRQPYATKAVNVNPFAVFTWRGTIRLTPGTDFWTDTRFAAPRLINRTVNTRGAARQGTVWSNWRWQWNFPFGNGSVRTRTTTQFTSSTTRSSSERVISTQVIPFMRGIDISFNARGMRPYTRVYPFFSNRGITANVQPNGGQFGDALTTDKNGNVTGTFRVPTGSSRFATGRNVFRLVDHVGNSYNRNDYTTHASAVHTSRGRLQTRQRTVVTTRTLGAITTQDREVRRWDDFGGGNGADPIAQSFTINTPGGQFITAVEVYFKTKSRTDIPCRIQIRTMENGIPTHDVVPMGEVWKTPEEVNVTNDASVPTKFEFDDPIFLDAGGEYAIVILAETTEYEAYVAEMGGTVINARKSVAKQPHLGSFFMSQNGSTWTPDQNVDMMFTLYRAKFDIANNATVVFDAPTLPSWVIGTNPVTTTNGSADLNVRIPSHGFKVGDQFTMAGATSGNGQGDAELNKTHTVTGVPGIDDVTVNTGVNATADGAVGGSNVSVNHHYPASLLFSNIREIRFDNTETKWEFSIRNQSSRSMTAYQQFTPNENVPLSEEMVVRGPGDLKFRATMLTNQDNLSPVIDAESLGAVQIYNRINTDTTNETTTYLGAAKAKYVTKTVNFDNPSTSAKMYFGAFLPGNTGLEIYYKLVIDDENLANKAWVALTPDQSFVNDESNFNEYSALIDGVGSFSGIKVKVVMTSDDSTIVPMIKDFRMIALA